MSHRYRPASEYDDATLAQKREYWRTKKREQRARLSERRGKATQNSQGRKPQLVKAPAGFNSSLTGSVAAFSSALQSNDESYKTANVSPTSQSGKTLEDSSTEDTESQGERWLESVDLNKVLPKLPGSRSISDKAAGGDTVTVTCLTARGAVGKADTSSTPGRTPLNTKSSVPPVRVSRITNGSSVKLPPQPCVSMQGGSVPKTQKTLHIQPQLLATSVTASIVTPLHVPVSIKPDNKSANTSPQNGTTSALVTSQRPKGASNSHPSLESEEERAAKRREQWRIKKREQRAKMAARIAKARERMQGKETSSQRQTAQKAGSVGAGNLEPLPSHSFLRGVAQKLFPTRVKPPITSIKRENDKLLVCPSDQVKEQSLHGSRRPWTAIASDAASLKKLRGISRCKTPRQRLIEVQKNFMNQRNMRCKSPLIASVLRSKSIPKIDPSDTPEQIIAKRREYWRIKKREQRAKLSMEVKARLKEKDSLMRRAKRYQKILEEMRRARVLAQSAGSPLSHASETIGGFIKEDGTVTINIPQVPTLHNPAQAEEEPNLVSNNCLTVKPQHQPDAKWRNISPIRISQSPLLRSTQVKVSLPGQLVSKSPKLLSLRARTQHVSTSVPSSLVPQSVSQLTLTHPQTCQNAASGSSLESNLGGCVMKMAVSSSALSMDTEMTEEERMAKKREYWRVKKREQRAARAFRLKQGLLQARANAALQRRKAQKQAAVTAPPQGRRTTHRTSANAHPPPNDGVSVPLNANETKQESGQMPADDLISQPAQAICPDIKPPISPTAPPAPQPESDPALAADSQAATLLAVASMKKLLEESLSTVTECQSTQTDIKVEVTEEAVEPEVKPKLPQLFFEKDEVDPISADLALEIKSWQPDTDVLLEEDSTSPHLKDIPEISEPIPPLPASTEEVLYPTCEHSSQTPLNFILSPMECSDGPSSPQRTQRLCSKKAAYQDCSSSPEPPKLHHLPMDQPQPQQQQCEQLCQAQQQRRDRVVPENSGLSTLQRKREYWKLMKRQQRARLKARKTARLSQEVIQAAGPGLNNIQPVNTSASQPVQPKPCVASLTAAGSIPTTLLISPTSSDAEQSPDTLQVKLPVSSVSCSPESQRIKYEPPQMEPSCVEALENQAILGAQKWISGSSEVDSAPCLPTLKPPDNPLSSINLQPIELPGQTQDSTLSPTNIPGAHPQSPTDLIQLPNKLVPVTTMVPPKPIPGESEEDFLKRKREYWRVKKKEQRARKAIRDKGITPNRDPSNWKSVLPAQDVQTQDSCQWVSSSEESEHPVSSSPEDNTGSFPCTNFVASLEDETELQADYETSHDGEDPISDAVWRSRYLMDYDPLNQLLVCIVCGEMQYSHSLEGVRAHIEEAHPDTLNMDPWEKQRILETWDEQVSQRERFFTSQLQQHSETLSEAHNRDVVN